jgi:hypothetical protein
MSAQLGMNQLGGLFFQRPLPDQAENILQRNCKNYHK